MKTVGLGICALLGVLDIVSVAGAGAEDAPPLFVTVAAVVLGVITLVAIRPAARGSRRGHAAIIVSRVLSALSGVPAFFVADVPGWVLVVVSASILLTVVGVGLLMAGSRAATVTA